MNTIFIQIASYRDSQLPYTLRDCLQMSEHPENLRFCIAHQYDETEDLSEFEDRDQFHFIKIPYRNSKGVCWARNLIQHRYNNEKYTLQLDSHHRFVEGWDSACIQMMESLQDRGYKKPMLTTYLPSFDPDNDPGSRVNVPWKMNFDRFIPEGAVFFLPAPIENHKEVSTPLPSRFYSAHFCFALGAFCKEVPHDPNFYFHSEEISIAVRAFTWGYDLFHPHKVIAWHEYARRYRVKHWDDNADWVKLNVECHKRNRQLFQMDGEAIVNLGAYGFGRERTLRQYEEYAGICFSQRAVQSHTLRHIVPPNPKVDDFEASLLRVFKHCIDIRFSDVPEEDYDFWCVAFHGKNDEVIYRQDAAALEIIKMKADQDGYCKIWREFSFENAPAYWVVWPHSVSKGWCTRLTGPL